VELRLARTARYLARFGFPFFKEDKESLGIAASMMILSWAATGFGFCKRGEGMAAARSLL
jgi:hypothetical protein